jgi:putative Holliday junction resolvase
MPERLETLLGFDFGTVRIGVAVGNTLTRDARPLEVLDNRIAERGFSAISRLLKEWGPQRLVVGRPVHPDGNPHALTARCERFARQLGGRFGLPVELVDERYSSAIAASEAGSQLAEGVDAEAAAIILRQYLESLSSLSKPNPDPNPTLRCAP